MAQPSMKAAYPGVDPRVSEFIGGRTRKMLIDGKWVEAASGKTFTTYDPATEEPLAEVPAGDKEDVDRAVRAARRAFESGPWRRMTASERGRAIWKLADLIEARTRGVRAARDARQRQAAQRRARRRRAARRRPLPLLRRLGDEGRRRDHPGLDPRPALPQLHAARAGRRRRPDHPVELPAADGGVEARRRARLRQHRRPEAGRADAALGAAARRAARRGRHPARRRQHRHRLRRDRRRGDRRASRRRQGRVHRLDRGRPARSCAPRPAT